MPDPAATPPPRAPSVPTGRTAPLAAAIFAAAVAVTVTFPIIFARPAVTVRTPDTIRRDGNALAAEPSLYLRQHAHNPVDWLPWGDAALAKAKREDKPIFLSVGYSSCHWCHVMEHEVFDADDAATFLNEHFVAIKVDREERPDIDAVYMEAVQALTGSGGWPMSVWLTPDLKPFYGGTYFPKDRFLYICEQLLKLFREDRRQVDERSGLLALRLASGLPLDPAAAFDRRLHEKAVERGKRSFDRTWGGFRAPMKFPTPVRWSYLLHRLRDTGDDVLAVMVRGTLDAIASGGIHDHVGGGFHRYTVDESWTVPHFEKMLYDNAQLASLFLEAGAVFGEARYTEVGLDTLRFLLAEMSGPEGGLYASFDADSGGVEGSYYVFTPDEVTQAAGPADGPALAALLGVTDGGNFEGHNVLTRRTAVEEAAQRFGRPAAEVAGLFAKHRAALAAFRARRTAPGLDRKVVVSWNGLAISALALAARVTGDVSWARAGARAAAYIFDRHVVADDRPGVTLRRASTDGGAAVGTAVLDDYANLAAGLFGLFSATGDAAHLERALALCTTIRTRFAHPMAGFYLTAEGDEAPLGRQTDVFDSVVPSGTSAALNALLTAALLTGDAALRDAVRRHLNAHAEIVETAELETAGWLDVALRLDGTASEVVIAGAPGADDTRALLAAAGGLGAPWAIPVPVGAGGADAALAAVAPALADKPAVGGRATAWVCRFGSCLPPIHDPAVLIERLKDGRRY